jgi:hypothetical protein
MEEIHNWEEGSLASSTDFTIGQMVALRSDPTRVGVIINVFPGTPENRYHVFLDNTPATYYQGFGPLSPLPIKNGMGNVVGSTEKEEIYHFTRRPITSEKGLPRQALS